MQFQLPSEIDTLAQSENGVAFPIVSLKTGDPIVIDGVPLTITAKGMDSEAYEAAVREADRRQTKVEERGDKYPVTERISDILAAVSVSWTGIHSTDGQPAQCTVANAKALYMACPEIRSQMLGRVTQRGNFIRPSATA